MTSLKELPTFETLTLAEARIFEQAAIPRMLAEGDSVGDEDAILLVRGGALEVAVGRGESARALGALGPGDVHGEMNLFEVDPVPTQATSTGATTAYAWSREGLKNAFRYSRVGAAKFMAAFSTSLSRKLRLANELLHDVPELADTVAPRPRELAPRDLQRLRSFSVSRAYPAGAVIFEQGDVGGELYVIAEGEVDIVRRSASGESTRLATLVAGDFFGEMAFVDEKQRSASAVVRERLRAHVVPAGSLERIVELNVGTGLYLTNLLCKIMSRRLNATLHRIASAS